MRKLTHSGADNMERERRFRKLVPVVAGAIALSFTFGVPAKSDAEQPPQVEQCSASVERGRISSFTSTSARSRILRTPLLESNRYLQISMPNSYMGQVSQAASERPEPERQDFVTDIMQKNVSASLAALGSNPRVSRSVTFICAPTAPAAAPQPSQPAPTITTEESPSQPPPAPAQDGGTGQPPEGRRRVIQPGAVPAPVPSSKAAPAPKQSESTAIQAPIPPIRKGGKGTDTEPFVVEIPVPSKRAGGTELYREKFPYTNTDADTSQKIYISLRFVAASGTTITSKNQLVGQLASLASTLMEEALRANNIDSSPSSGSLSGSIGVIVGHAKKKDADVRAYATES
ncbi:MAG: hypothetical protein V1861_04890 [Candidatus Micrarchaeota archaeon]